MYLEELIEKLEQYPSTQKVAKGFNYPHSYRGYYEQLAFEPCNNTTVGAMLDCAKEALGNTYTGYKGGEFTMHKYTMCWLSCYGNSSQESLGETLLGFMLGDF
tara:strand:- start:688 stop:996 length:309 start_codon:yes stop_codon:yes gene_type:complete